MKECIRFMFSPEGSSRAAAASRQIELQPSAREHLGLLRHDPDRYTLLGEHGRGGLGTVTRAFDRALGRDVAIKEMLVSGDAAQARFVREAKITARLEHPGIVPVHEAGQWPDGTPFYVMKLVAGRSMKEALAECKSATGRLAMLPHVAAVADAVAYAHKRNIIHRDLKPGNVIVGDFGETIVIDWGLAKDLSEHEEPAIDAPFRLQATDDLTATGAAVGTPIYMAPEQARGQRVDQRADVYAIGAMLWEVCSGYRVPPLDDRHRDRTLRRAQIDADLVAIIGKALTNEASARYRDAGELAFELKQFMSGARIASRRYSPIDVVMHWIDRHRALAATIGVAAALVLVGTIAYVGNISIERERAERARDVAVLSNAELLLRHDPSAVPPVLAGYHGTDRVRAKKILAEAHGRGVAERLFRPHADTIWFLAGAPNGAIYSMGEDRLLRVTERGVSSTIASDVSPSAPWTYAYAASRQRLAYVTVAEDISVIDLPSRHVIRIPVKAATYVAIAQDGDQIAVLDANQELTVWKLSPTAAVYRESRPTARSLMFADSSTIVVREVGGVRSISVDQHAELSRELPVTTFEARGPDVAIAHGKRISLLSRSLADVTALDVCRETVYGIRFAESAKRLAFACSEGTAGVIAYDTRERRMSIIGAFSVKASTTYAEPDPFGHRIVVTTDTTTVYDYDVDAKLLASYEGQPSSVSFVAAPTRDFARALVGDVDGNVRVWQPRDDAARQVLKATLAILGTASSPDARTLIAYGAKGLVRVVDLTTHASRELLGHRDDVLWGQFSPGGSSFASLDREGELRVWEVSTSRLLRVVEKQVRFDYADERTIVSIGDDRTVRRWSIDGTVDTQLYRHTERLVGVVALDGNRTALIDVRGTLLELTSHTAIVRASAGPATILRVSSSNALHLLALGGESGHVTVYDTKDFRIVSETTVGSPVRRVAIDPRGRDYAVVSDAGNLTIVALKARRAPSIRELHLDAVDVSYTQDGSKLGLVGGTGEAWFFTPETAEWSYVRDHTVDAISGRFVGGDAFVSTSSYGSVVLRTSRDRDPVW